MKKLIPSILLILPLTAAFGQNAPVDFEEGGNGADWSWNMFENGDDPELEIVANPDPSGINTSATVAKFTARAAGAPFAGVECAHASDIGTFTINAENNQITIMVWKSVISDVGIKLVQPGNASLGEIKIANTLVNQWEQITYNFSSHAGITYDQIVVFPDFRGRTEDEIIYFDNIYGDVVTSVESQTKSSTPIFYPNPAQNQIRFAPGTNVEQVRISDLNGKLVAQSTSLNDGGVMNIENLPVGVYILNCTIDGSPVYQKLIKH